MQRKAILVCLDGYSPSYLRAAGDNIRRLRREGYYSEFGKAVVPTVTNVNNVSIVTGTYPSQHGITSNCFYDREKGIEVYMESSQSITAPTIFEKLNNKRKKSVLLSAKDKLANLLNKGPETTLSAEKPPDWIKKIIGEPPEIYSIEVNSWLLKAASVVLDKLSPDFIYVSTTDYVGHKYGPDEAEAQRHTALIDEGIGELAEKLSGNMLCITADHGMSAKTRAINLRTALAVENISSWVIPTVKDKHVVHHSNLSGSAYIYLLEGAAGENISEVLDNAEGVEEVLTAEEASPAYHLPKDRVGDYLVLGEEDTVFGEVSDEIVSDVKIRSHGSLHERTIPLIAHGDNLEVNRLVENKDLANIVLGYLNSD